jgi:ADP-ribose pyrophosphatase YjhB (NUDIX family)
MGKRRDNGKWTQPGGHLEAGESSIEGAVREVKEEAGLDIDPSKLKEISEEAVTKPSGEKIKVTAFLYHLKDDQQTSMKEDPDAEVHRWHWITPDRLFSKEVWDNLHVPPKDNVLMKGLGFFTDGMNSNHFHNHLKAKLGQHDFQKEASVKPKSHVQLIKDKYSHYLAGNGGDHSGYEYLQKAVKDMKVKYKDYMPIVKNGMEKSGMKAEVNLKDPEHKNSWYPKDQVAKGHIVEKEHSDNMKVRDIITKNHLDEEGQKSYYNDSLFKKDLEKKAFWRGFFHP